MRDVFEGARRATRGQVLADSWLAALDRAGVVGIRLRRGKDSWSSGACAGRLMRIDGPDSTNVELFGEPSLSRTERVLLGELASVMCLWFHRIERFAGVSQRAHRERIELRRQVAQLEGEDLGLLGRSEKMREVRRLIRLVATHPTTVLITGETGTGKEIAARAIHRLSRRNGSFVAINCAALPAPLVEAELFGHVRGAFTGALAARDGLLLSAAEGTVFLDEIAELPKAAQAKLLRVLQEREVVPLGSDRPRPFRARVVAASHRTLEREVDAGRFRQDLFYRLSAFPLRMPSLRDRSEDVPLLAEARIATVCARTGGTAPRILGRVRARLMCYGWPGNVRELENEIERALLLSDRETFEWEAPAATRRAVAFDESVVHTIEDALRACDGRVYGARGAAARLGLRPSTLQTKMKKHGIERTRFVRSLE